jgi:hypothetical protein
MLFERHDYVMAAGPGLQRRHFRPQVEELRDKWFQVRRKPQQKLALGFIRRSRSGGTIYLQAFHQGLVFFRQDTKKFPIQPHETFRSKKFFIFKV